MIPSDLRLLQTARRTVNELGRRALPADVTASLKAVDLALNELMLRQGREFYRTYCEQGRVLIEKGLTLEIGNAATRNRWIAALEQTAEGNSSALHRESLDAAIDQVTAVLNEVVSLCAGRSEAAVRAYLNEVTDWEVTLYAHRLENVGSGVSEVDDPMSRVTAAALQDYLRRKFPQQSSLEIKSFSRVPGGFSKATFLVELSASVKGTSSIAVRVEPVVKFMDLDGSDIADEFQVVSIAHEAGMTLPEPLWFEDDRTHFGLRFIVSRRMPGKNLGDVKGSQTALPDSVERDLASILARIHAVPLDAYRARIERCHLRRWYTFGSLNEATRAFVEYWYGQAEKSGIGASPLVTRGLSWLAQNVPSCAAAPVFLHGDVGLHNILVEDGKIAALLDWEVSRIGDPAEDLANLFTNTSGQIDRVRFLQHYRDAGGCDISEYRLRYFDVYHAVKMCIAALASLRRVEDFPGSSIGFAVFGLQYIHYTAAKLNELIALAEQARDR